MSEQEKITTQYKKQVTINERLYNERGNSIPSPIHQKIHEQQAYVGQLEREQHYRNAKRIRKVAKHVVELAISWLGRTVYGVAHVHTAHVGHTVALIVNPRVYPFIYIGRRR